MRTDSYIYREKQGGAPDAPLFFLLHGTGGDENQFMGLGDQLLPGARLIGVRGDVSEHGALRYFRRTGEGVYDMDDLAARTEKLAGFIARQKQAGAPRKVVGLGYSNGANILASVLFAAPALFDEAILLHPLIPFTPAPQPGLAGRRVLITAGRHDPICPAPMTQGLADYFSAQGALVELAWHQGGHEIRQEELAAIQGFLRS